MAITAKAKPLINSKGNNHGALTLVGMDFNGWNVYMTATDDHNGVWTAKAAKNQPDLKTELRIVLKCKTAPKVSPEKTDPPDDGKLTITLTKTGTDDLKPMIPVDYANDDPLQ